MCCSSIHAGAEHAPGAEQYPTDPSRECTCPGQPEAVDPDPYGCGCGTVAPQGCCGAATGDDGLCDRCRQHCKTNTDPTTATEVIIAPEPAMVPA
jgi:hypothetical protein